MPVRINPRPADETRRDDDQRLGNRIARDALMHDGRCPQRRGRGMRRRKPQITTIGADVDRGLSQRMFGPMGGDHHRGKAEGIFPGRSVQHRTGKGDRGQRDLQTVADLARIARAVQHGDHQNGQHHLRPSDPAEPIQNLSHATPSCTRPAGPSGARGLPALPRTGPSATLIAQVGPPRAERAGSPARHHHTEFHILESDCAPLSAGRLGPCCLKAAR